jgi:hypothetical protein
MPYLIGVLSAPAAALIAYTHALYFSGAKLVKPMADLD